MEEDDDDVRNCNETDDDKSNIRAQLISLEASLTEKEERVSQLELELSAVQAKCKEYKKECKQLSKELRCRRQDLRDCLRASKRCRMYERSDSCKCHCHGLKSADQNTQTFATDFCDVESSGSPLDWVPLDGEGRTIADVVQDAVTSINQSSDYVYDKTNNLYYSVSTGYYYDPTQKLFYEPNSRTYYSYKESDKTYHFHSQLPDPKPPKKKKKKGKQKKDKDKEIELEEGEISSDGSDSCILIDSSSSDSSDSSKQENADDYPPSIRLIVKKSEKLPAGSLLLVTFDGATVGRTDDQGVCIQDNGISRKHARIEYNQDKACYLLYDLGSQNGTFVNKNRLTEPKESSKKGCKVHHGDWITFGSTELVAHIHSGHKTCDQCEPGILLMEEERKNSQQVQTKEDKEDIRRDEVRRMKEKYGLVSSERYGMPSGYVDRAELRRVAVGSSNPHEKDAEPSSVDKPVSTDNPGFRMLQKLGWKEGEALGQGNSGLKEPINAYDDGQIGRAGLGTRAAYKEMCESSDIQIVIIPDTNKEQLSRRLLDTE